MTADLADAPGSAPAPAVFVSWVKDHTRSRVIADHLGIEAVFIHHTSRFVGLRYMHQFVATVILLRRRRPSAVVIMIPPTVALVAVFLACGFRTPVVCDVHSGAALNRPWKSMLRSAVSFTRRTGGFVIATNDQISGLAVFSSVSVVNVHDPIGGGETGEGARRNANQILVPLTYAADEPVEEILKTAWKLADITWVLTGEPPQDVVSACPPNVVLTGYVSREQYWNLLNECTGVLALTTREATMQCAGYEAMSVAAPLTTSDTEALRRYFGDAALYADASADGIAAACREMVSRADIRTRVMQARRSEILQEEQLELEHLTTALQKTIRQRRA